MKRNLLILFCAIFLVGCATILQDDSQPVSFSSEPQGSIVSINGMPQGTTPCTIMIKRSNADKMFEIKKEGYQVVTCKLEESIDAAAFGNIVFGGIIGGAVDAISGKGANYQDSVKVTLIPEGKSGTAVVQQGKPKEKPATDKPDATTEPSKINSPTK